MSAKVVVVDYGIGNVRSVCQAFKYSGADVLFSSSPADIEGADRVVLPGVGAISLCMEELHQRGLDEALFRYTERERPFLGICVGMQLMLDVSWEFTKCRCFGWISGDVIEVPRQDLDGRAHKIPHIAWSALSAPSADTNWDGTILQGIGADELVYFVHSFMANPQDKGAVLAQTSYDGVKICAAVRLGNLTGTQFHPEKSGAVGLRIIENFLAL